MTDSGHRFSVSWRGYTFKGKTVTEQFQQPNINQAIPRGARFIAASTALNQDDDLIVVDSSAGPVAIDLYSAAGAPGNMVYIKAATGAVNPVTISAVGGQTIDGAPSITLDQNFQAIVLKVITTGPFGITWIRVAEFSDAAAGIVVPGTIPGLGVLENPFGPGVVLSSILSTDPAGFAGTVFNGDPANDPYSLTGVVVDVETSTLEVGATLIDRIPLGLGGGVTEFTYTISNVASFPNPNDASLTRFRFDVDGTIGVSGTFLAVAMGILNPSGGADFAGYFAVVNAIGA